MKSFIISAVIVSSLATTALWAGSMGSEGDVEPCWGPAEACSSPRSPIHYTQNRLFAFSIGPAWSRNGQSQTITLQPGVTNTYSAKIQSNVFPYMEALFGMEKQLSQMLYTQLGIELGGGSAARFRGTVTQANNPSFSEKTYSYNVQELRVLVKGKLLFDLNFYATRPFLSAGVGIGFNHSYSYAEKPSPVPPPFRANTQTALTSTLGVGFEEIINEHWHVAIGYEFANWGRSQLDAAANQTTAPGLVVNNVYINSVLISLLFLA